jgi:hypothetical protein
LAEIREGGLFHPWVCVDFFINANRKPFKKQFFCSGLLPQIMRYKSKVWSDENLQTLCQLLPERVILAFSFRIQ